MELVTHLGIVLVAFLVLMWGASRFVEGAVGLAQLYGIPKLVVGIVLVSMATTAPEFTVSVYAAFQGEPAIALGNAVGSVICDDGLALGLAGVLTLAPIVIQPGILRTTGLFILGVDLLVFILALNGTLGRLEGAFFLLLLAGYFVFVIRNAHKKRRTVEVAKKPTDRSPGKLWFDFFIGVTAVIIASKFVVDHSIELAQILGVPEVIIGLIGVALGTSLPEVVTCVVSARKGEGQIVIGNILGADILNVLWIVGMSSLVNPIEVTTRQIYFMFPSMIVVVGVMLLLMRLGHTWTRGKGIIMLALYVVFLILTFFVFPLQGS